MSGPPIHGKRKPVTASLLLQVLADDLCKIKSEDRLTWADIGEVLRRSPDQAAKYADGTATMDWVAYQRGKAAWNGRFSGSVERLLGEVQETPCPRETQSTLLKAALALSVALEDGELSDAEIAANRATLERSRDAIDGLLGRLGPKAGARA